MFLFPSYHRPSGHVIHNLPKLSVRGCDSDEGGVVAHHPHLGHPHQPPHQWLDAPGAATAQQGGPNRWAIIRGHNSPIFDECQTQSA